MTAHFDEFEEEMTSRSLERAYDYVDEHRIGGLEEVSAGLFHAEVHGSELYDVDIRLRGNDIVFASCTCPYDYDGYCKHIGAVLLTLRDYKHGGNHQQNVTYDAMIAKQDDSRPDIPVAANPLASNLKCSIECCNIFENEWDCANQNGGRRSAFLSGLESGRNQCHRDCESGNRERHGTIDARKRRGSRHGISHAATSRQGLRLEIRMGDAAINGVMAVFEEAEQSNDYPLAMRRMCAALRKTVCSRDKSMMKRVRYRHISNTSMSGSSLIRMPRHQSLQASKRSRC